MLLIALICGGFAAAELPEGRIAYVSGPRQSEREVRVLDLATGAVETVCPKGAHLAPTWSPDGAWLAFESLHDDGSGSVVRIVRADGSELQSLRHARSWNRRPAWGPESDRVAYSSSDGDPREEVIQVYDIATGAETVWGGGQGGLVAPVWLGRKSLLVPVLQARMKELGGREYEAWSRVVPDPANTLLCVGMAPEAGRLSSALYVVTPDHALPLPAVALPSEGAYEEWGIRMSPNGRQVAFETNDGGDREIYVTSHKGAFCVSNHREADWNPVWSPDGNRIAFESFRGGRRGVYLVNPDTARVDPVQAPADADVWGPSWSPDGHWLAVVTNQSGGADIAVTSREGDVLQVVASDAVDALAPAWRPTE